MPSCRKPSRWRVCAKVPFDLGPDAPRVLRRGDQGSGARDWRVNPPAEDRGRSCRCAAHATSRPAAPRTHCRCSLSRWSGFIWKTGGAGRLTVADYRNSAESKARSKKRVAQALSGRRRPAYPEGPRCATGAAAPRPHPVARRHRSGHRRATPPCRPGFGDSCRCAAPDPDNLVEQRLLTTDRRQEDRREHHRAGARGPAAAVESA